MIYIISEDNFFTLGLKATLKQSEMDATHICLPTLDMIKESISKHDIILVCAQSRETSRIFTRLAQDTDAKIIHFVDAVIEKVIFNNYKSGLFNKKIKKTELIDALFNMRGSWNGRHISLSRRETTIMDLFAQEKNATRIAKLLKLSIKTVCAHKMNALNKMGISHLNIRSILIYESVFQTPLKTFTF